MPGRFNFQQHITLELLIEEIIDRASNEPGDREAYVRLLCVIKLNLPVSYPSFHPDFFNPRNTFSNQLTMALNTRLNRYFNFVESDQMKRIGILLILGDMYRLKEVSQSCIRIIINHLLRSSHEQCQIDLPEFLEVAGCSLDYGHESNDEISPADSENEILSQSDDDPESEEYESAGLLGGQVNAVSDNDTYQTASSESDSGSTDESENEGDAEPEETTLTLMPDHPTDADAISIRCAICQESAVDKHPVSTQCGHVFCETCLKRWLGTRRRRKCPACRDIVSSSSNSKRRYHRLFF